MDALLTPQIAFWEKVVRSVVVYLFILVAFRFTGKRQVGQLTPFDLVVLLLIWNVAQNAAIGPETSPTGGFIGAPVILMLNGGIAEVTFRSKRARRLLEASPTLLVHNGRILHAALARERVTLDDLHAALRRAGVIAASEVRSAVLQENGAISVVPRGPTPPPGTLPGR